MWSRLKFEANFFQLCGRLFEITGGREHVAVANGGHSDDRPPGEEETTF